MNENFDMNTAEDARIFAERQQRSRLVNFVVPAIASAVLISLLAAVDPVVLYNNFPVPRHVLLLTAILLLAYSGLSLVMEYLQTGFKRSVEFRLDVQKFQSKAEKSRLDFKDEFIQMAEELRRETQRLRDEVASSKDVASFLNDDDRLILIDELMRRVNSEASAKLLAEFETQFEKKYSREVREKELLQQFSESRVRLTKELDALGWRGNLNLGLGAITTFVGLSMLGYGVFFGMVNAPKDLWGFVYHFFPRLTLVVMIELFAYFFLSLYKTSLAEIKYFQNEITNIEAKQVALHAALSHGDKEIIGNTLEKLAATERNHILSKDQTTVEIEKAKIEKDKKSEIAKSVSEWFQKKA